MNLLLIIQNVSNPNFFTSNVRLEDISIFPAKDEVDIIPLTTFKIKKDAHRTKRGINRSCR